MVLDHSSLEHLMVLQLFQNLSTKPAVIDSLTLIGGYLFEKRFLELQDHLTAAYRVLKSLSHRFINIRKNLGNNQFTDVMNHSQEVQIIDEILDAVCFF